MRAFARSAIALSMVATATSGAWAQDADGPPDNERYALRAEAGAEYDSNPHRTEVIGGAVDRPIMGSALERFVLAASLYDEIVPGQAIALAATAAGKLFDTADAASEDVAVAQSSGAWRLALGPRTRLLASGAYYEAFQSPSSLPAVDAERRDFRSLFPTLQLGWLPSERLDLTFTGGWRWLVFKSDRDYDFAGPAAAADLRWAHQQEAGPDWELGVGGAIERRSFGGPAFVGACTTSGLPCPGPNTRLDDLVMGHVEMTRTARVLLGIGYALNYNRSNSFGESVTRHFATARFATRLPFELSLAARAELLFAFYRDTVSVSAGSAFVSIDDENRSNARMDLSRTLSETLSLYLRYTLYFSELGNNAGTYTRQTLLLSLLFTLEN